MSVKLRNNVEVSGSGPATMFFAHGFGCDQNMWRLLAPAYASRSSEADTPRIRTCPIS